MLVWFGILLSVNTHQYIIAVELIASSGSTNSILSAVFSAKLSILEFMNFVSVQVKC